MNKRPDKPPMRTPRGAILAGGRASRYGGTAKGLLECGGVRIIDRLIAEMKSSGVAEIIIIANDPQPYRSCGREIVPDLRTAIGPLGGIEAGLAHYAARCDAVLFLPCDLPGITANEISLMMNAFDAEGAPIVVAEDEDFFWHSLCTVVHTGFLDRICKAIDNGKRSVHRVWREFGAVAVHFEDPAPFFNVNTPDDMRRWQENHRICK